MRFEWDPKKAAANLRKHGIAFEDATGIFFGYVVERLDTREDYGEERIVATGVAKGRLVTVCYTWRGTARRIISAHRPDRADVRYYRRALR